jgi:hypothetical protein
MILALAAILGLARNRLARLKWNVSPAEPENELEWQSFESRDGRFSILFPGKPTQRLNRSGDTTGRAISSPGWVLDSEGLGASFFVFYFDAPVEADKVEDLLDATCVTVAEKMHGELLEARNLTIDEYPGREVGIAGKGVQQGSTQISRFYYVNGRHYHLGVTFRRDWGEADYVRRYLNSFRLLEP